MSETLILPLKPSVPRKAEIHMYASLILTGILLVILGFYALVRYQQRALEGGVYHAPLSDPEEWSASLDVALSLDYFSSDSEENAKHMVPARPMVKRMPMVVRACPTYTLRTLAHICMC